MRLFRVWRCTVWTLWMGLHQYRMQSLPFIVNTLTNVGWLLCRPQCPVFCYVLNAEDEMCVGMEALKACLTGLKPMTEWKTYVTSMCEISTEDHRSHPPQCSKEANFTPSMSSCWWHAGPTWAPTHCVTQTCCVEAVQDNYNKKKVCSSQPPYRSLLWGPKTNIDDPG